MLIDAAAACRRRGRLGQAVVVLAGDAQGRDGYVQRVAGADRPLGPARSTSGWSGTSRMSRPPFAAAHVTVVASIEPEAFGRTAIEAAAVGCPVIATDIGAPPETVLAEPAVPRGRHHRLAGAARATRTPWRARLADALALAPAERPATGRAGAPARARALIRWRPCSAARWPCTTGCWALP